MSKSKSKKNQAREVDEDELQDDYHIKPSNKPAKLDTSDWPLLLKVLISPLNPFLICSRITIVSTPKPTIILLFLKVTPL